MPKIESAQDDVQEVTVPETQIVKEILEETPVDVQAQSGEVQLQAQDDVQAAAAQQPERQNRTRLGIMGLLSSTGQDKVASELTRAMIGKLDTLGLYEMYYPEDIEKALRDARARVPGDCRDQQCVNDIGRALGMRRMIYGSVDMIGSRSAVHLVLLNVISGKPIETVSIEGGDGIPAADVLFTAIDRLHGHIGQASVTPYYGPPVDNMSEFLWSTVAVQGTGIFYSLINFGVGGSSGGGDVDYVPYYRENLSGIYAASNQIPFFARPAALANAYTAISDDAYGVLYNPAGMPWVGQRDIAAGYQYRFGIDLLAVSYANRALRDLGFGQAILLAADRDGAMTEVFFVTAVGYKINQSPLFGPMSVGGSLKLMGNSVKNLSPDSPMGQSYGIGFDVGFMWELASNIRYGLMFRDVPAVNKWKNRTTGSQYMESLPPTLHMGGSYRASYSTFLTADGQIPLYEDQPWVMAGGIEYEIFKMIALRVGLQREILDDEANWWKITGGIGFKFDTKARWGKYTMIDVSYEYNTLELFPVANVSVRVGF